MPKTVTASEAKNRLGAVLSWVQTNHDEVIIENRGEPAVVIMSYSEYEKVKQLKEEQRRQDALQRLRTLRDEVRSRNQDIATVEQALHIADQFSHDLLDDLVKKGEVRFEQE
ncbi:MAG TPA: type II toxin-antitoxin system Phd/YefM family antitoxin [Chloroflexia bacterium]|jgi:prevent-host-death family protein